MKYKQLTLKERYHISTLLKKGWKQKEIAVSIGVLDAVGHRVVHGGSDFSEPILITPEVIETIRSLIPLAPPAQPSQS